MVVIASVTTDFSDGVPVTKISYGFGKGVETRGGTVEELEEPAGHGLGGLVGVGWLQVERYDMGLIVDGLACQEGHMSVVSHLDVFSIHSSSVSQGDGDLDSPIVRYVSAGASGSLEVGHLALLKRGDAGLESIILLT